jgi:hypothetical protein
MATLISAATGLASKEDGLLCTLATASVSVQHAISTAVNDAYNVCSAVIHAQAAEILVITVYRAPLGQCC